MKQNKLLQIEHRKRERSKKKKKTISDFRNFDVIYLLFSYFVLRTKMSNEIKTNRFFCRKLNYFVLFVCVCVCPKSFFSFLFLFRFFFTFFRKCELHSQKWIYELREQKRRKKKLNNKQTNEKRFTSQK